MARRRGPDVAVSVIVVAHDSARWIRDCVGSLIDQQLPGGHEVIIIDHESSDGTPSIVRKEFPRVRLVEQPNRGFGAGANRGVREARGRVVAFANPDTLAEPGWLSELTAPLSEPGLITTSQVLLMDEPGRVNTLGHEIHRAGFGFTRGYGRAATAKAGTEPVAAFSGAAFAMRRDDFEGLGGFDEDLFLYLEDTELSWRAQKAGLRVRVVPSSRIRHNYAFRLTPEKLFHVERGRRILLRKHLSRWDRVRFAPSLGLARLLTWALARQMGDAGRDAVRRARRDAHSVSERVPLGGIRRGVPLAATWRVPFGELGVAHGRSFLGGIMNAVFWLNAPLRRRRIP